MKRIFYIITLSIIVASCKTTEPQKAHHLESATANPEAPVRESKSEFQVVCESLPKIDLPFELYCEDCCLQPKLTDEQAKIWTYLPEGSSFMGVIELNEDYISLLTTYPADWVIPAVIVLDKNGNLIDEEVFLGGYCGSDYQFLSRQYFYIHSSTELQEIDSLFHVRYNEETFDIIDTVKTEINLKSFKVSATGITKSV